MAIAPALTDAEISAIIEMALSDHISFANIEREFGLSDKQVKALMRDNLKPSSYRTWRKRVREFGDRREHYKQDTWDQPET
ncbi:MAG: TIGR03643 family protein [Pseudomonadota bacterium]